jgi:hypothetical protein
MKVKGTISSLRPEMASTLQRSGTKHDRRTVGSVAQAKIDEQLGG